MVLTADPETMLMLSFSMPTEGDRAPKGASSGGKEVWRRGWAELVEAMDIVEGLRRLRAGEGPPSPAVRLRFEEDEPLAVVLMEGSWALAG